MRRDSVVVTPDARRLSALVWGEAPPELALLHGGAQNAHTWDTVALALDRPLVAVDLPGHGHSDHRPEGPFAPRLGATDVAVAVHALAPQAQLVVGMSLGGLTAIALTSEAPELVRRLALVDITPGVDRDKAAPVLQFIAGPESFASFEEILARTREFNPTRSESSLRRGVLHNAMRREDGRWVWRYQRPRLLEDPDVALPADFATLWEDVSTIAVPPTTPKWPNCVDASPTCESRSWRAPGTASKGTAPSSWRGCSTRFSTLDRRHRRSWLRDNHKGTQMGNRLRNKVVIITGPTSGIAATQVPCGSGSYNRR